ncbi:MAG: tRNA lysidine(34) synthetase TilS [Phycisphaeraceae bacterium]|nr:tRNA lysidine(34) synthetase TilS [Phycisphaeraceae bacterium]
MSRSRTLDLPARAARSALTATIESALRAAGVHEHGTMLVAISGGVDSSALLALAAGVAQRNAWRIEAATVDHHLRSESGGDAAHAMALAERLGVPAVTLDAHPGGGPGAPARARAERYRLLAEHARARTLRAVITAHHAEDQCETMLLALLRGAGPKAAGGMPLRRRLGQGVDLIRPLLSVSRGDLERLCRRLDIEWREDPSNRDPRAPRARLRGAVLPEFERVRLGAVKRMAAAGDLLRAAGALFERRAARALKRALLSDASARVSKPPGPPGDVSRRAIKASGRAGDVSSRSDDGPGRPCDAPAPTVSYDRGALACHPAPLRLTMLRQMIAASGDRAARRLLEAIDAALIDGREHGRRWRSRGGVEIRLSARVIRITAPAGSAPARDARRK